VPIAAWLFGWLALLGCFLLRQLGCICSPAVLVVMFMDVGGKLVTLFSAPDYPQFIADGDERYHNKAAVLHLSAPDYATPQVESFEAVLPRPQVR
jgi:hypothetical protein